MQNFTQLLHQRAEQSANQIAYRFLPNDRDEICLTYGQLMEAAQRLASVIQSTVPPGQRVALLYPAGLAFVQALFACFLAKVVAVPLPMPRPNESSHRLDHVLKDCEPAAIFTEASCLERIRAQIPDAYRSVVVATDQDFDCVPILQSTLLADREVALLQYTSGSTSKPKGVILRHANLLANLRQIEQAFGHTCHSVGVIWLPHYHDMGLVGGVLQPLFVGFPVTLFSPISFIQRPLRWLHAIHKYRATTSGGPNFAYELCVAKASTLDTHIDLSCWHVAFNGAEPVKASTLDAFSQTFSKAGFQRSAFVPCYGLAEATLIVSAVPKKDEPRVVDSSDKRITANGVAVPTRDRLVSCGVATQDTHIEVVGVNSNESCREGQVGEVLVHGPSVASGYWNKAIRMFSGEVSYRLRTGDLGFKLDGELFITGRLNDLIIIRGKNVFPEDIEATMRLAQPILAQEGAAAFSVQGEALDELVLVQEVSARALRAVDLIATRDEVSRLVMQHHGIGVSAFVPVRAGSLVRTSSGKISRFACKQLYVTRKLQSLPM